MKSNGRSNSILDDGCNPCTGCGVCAVACPRGSIGISQNGYGFLAPKVDQTSCNHCGICKESCYKYLNTDSYTPRAVYRGKTVLAATNNYFDQMSSVTSSGVASRLSSVLFNNGYEVCGVTFSPENDDCKHILVATVADTAALKGSKYLQSYTVDAFASLRGQRQSIVFGTPCQIYGFRREIIRKGIEDRFVLVDLFCRGVPSRLLWDSYKSYIQRQFGLGDFARVEFRSKRTGWHRFSMRICDSKGKEYCQSVYNDLFYYFYLHNLAFCPACYGCRLRHDYASSDIRLGDFWGEKYARFDDGVGLVVLLTKRGEKVWAEVESMLRCEVCNTEDIFQSQRIGKISVPDDSKTILDALRAETPLEQIFLEHKN